MPELTKKKYKLKLTDKRSKYKAADIIEEIINLKIREHYSNLSLIQHIRNKYGYTELYAYNFMNQASEKINEIQNQNITTVLQEQQAKMLAEIELMKKNGEHKSVILNWIKEYNKITGLHQEKIQLQGDFNITATFNAEHRSQTIQTSQDTERDN
jgi:hypothetical protein